jgi:molybdopterin synthase sulfur carrier subunit
MAGRDSNAPVRVILPRALLPLFPGLPVAVEVEAATVAEAIAALNARFPGIRDRLVDTRPALRRHIRLFVDGASVALDAPLAPGGELLVVTAISGG